MYKASKIKSRYVAMDPDWPLQLFLNPQVEISCVQ